jgi:hypothetical protein
VKAWASWELFLANAPPREYLGSRPILAKSPLSRRENFQVAAIFREGTRESAASRERRVRFRALFCKYYARCRDLRATPLGWLSKAPPNYAFAGRESLEAGRRENGGAFPPWRARGRPPTGAKNARPPRRRANLPIILALSPFAPSAKGKPSLRSGPLGETRARGGKR